MRRMGRGYSRTWTPDDWGRLWLARGPQPLTPSQLRLRNEIEAFRLVLAKKEPPCR